MKTSELIGPALDWAVAKCEGAENLRENPHRFNKRLIIRIAGRTEYIQDLRFSTDWAQGGPIMDREHIEIRPTITDGGYRTSDSPDAVHARILLPNGATGFDPRSVISEYGPTTLIAAMRCYCCAKLGDEIEIPEELQPCQQPNL